MSHYSSLQLETVTYPLLLHFVKSNLCRCPFVNICFLGFHLLIVFTVHDLLQAMLALFILLLLPEKKNVIDSKLISGLPGQTLPSTGEDKERCSHMYRHMIKWRQLNIGLDNPWNSKQAIIYQVTICVCVVLGTILVCLCEYLCQYLCWCDYVLMLMRPLYYIIYYVYMYLKLFISFNVISKIVWYVETASISCILR